MGKRPHSVTVIGLLYAATGTLGLVYHAGKFKAEGSVPHELVLVCLIRLMAIVCGVFTLRGRNWARWGLLGWMAYHVVLSAFHTPTELVLHALLLAVTGYILLRPAAAAFFRRAERQAAGR